jgi:PTS system nitrogen regulatory IIA component
MSEAIGRAETELELQAVKSPQAEPPFALGELLDEKKIIFLPDNLSKETILRELLARMKLPNPARALQAIMERETAGETIIGERMIIPHARIPGLSGLQLALGIHPSGPIQLWFAFLSPAEDPKAHLTFLAGVARFFQKPHRLEAIASLKTPQAVMDYFRSEK